LFNEHYSTFEESNLQDNTIYQSKSFLIPAIEFFIFRTDESGKKRVTFYRTSTKLPNGHPVRFDSIKKWFDSFNHFASHNSDVGVRIVSVVDWSESTVHGIKVTHDNVPYSLATMKKDESMVKIASRTETYIVRAETFSAATE
jgi:hypothetical protein